MPVVEYCICTTVTAPIQAILFEKSLCDRNWRVVYGDPRENGHSETVITLAIFGGQR